MVLQRYARHWSLWIVVPISTSISIIVKRLSISLFYNEKSTFSFVVIITITQHTNQIPAVARSLQYSIPVILSVIFNRSFIFTAIFVWLWWVVITTRCTRPRLYFCFSRRGIHLSVWCNQDLLFLVSLKTDQPTRHGTYFTSQLQWIYFYLSIRLHYVLVSLYIPNTRQVLLFLLELNYYDIYHWGLCK